MDKQDRLVTAQELADVLGIHRETVYSYARDGKIPIAFKLPDGAYRFRVADVVRALEGGV